MKFLLVTLLAILAAALPSAPLTEDSLEARQLPVACDCTLRVLSLVLSDRIPVGQGRIQRNMHMVNGSEQYCSVTFERGNNNKCNLFSQVAGPSGSGCTPRSGGLECHEAF
ncbi:hypothetical protein CSHISOI_07345 [Colletotrichum shisoi]|uniref:Uncharacterized protein n=1 Tax=Colletotrichum shisoi TaxID=2078593 RepID=A0A5Q4BM84_9PEZI|nr:hypothetical protein CSHISOI_07345 [Colletotrichum shisoi]